MRRALVLAALVVACGALAQGGAPAGRAPRLTVLAASSLTEVLPRIDGSEAYSFGGSDQLAFQIRQGAPADVFASASRKYADALRRAGLVEKPRLLVTNELVLAVPKSNPGGLRSVFDLGRKHVKLVIGNGQVPIGTYTREVLRRLGLSRVLSDVVSQEPDVKGIVGKLALGEADAGFVYRTDVVPVAGRVRAIAIPARAQPKVRYEIAVVKRSTHLAAARAYVTGLITDPRARRLFRAAGFGLR